MSNVNMPYLLNFNLLHFICLCIIYDIFGLSDRQLLDPLELKIFVLSLVYLSNAQTVSLLYINNLCTIYFSSHYVYTSQQKKSIFDFRGIYLNSGISHHQLIGIELCSDQL